MQTPSRTDCDVAGKGLLKPWFRLFESLAVVVLISYALLDQRSGTGVGRYLLQDLLAKRHGPRQIAEVLRPNDDGGPCGRGEKQRQAPALRPLGHILERGQDNVPFPRLCWFGCLLGPQRGGQSDTGNFRELALI